MKKIYVVVIILFMTVSGCDTEKERPGPNNVSAEKPESAEGTIIALGDSLSAGLGLDLEESYPAQLQAVLEADGYSFRVVNAGVSGETTSGTLSRLDWILSQKPDIVILEIGANDGLRGIDTTLIEKNLRQILTRLEEEGVITVFTGMKMVWNLGEEYTSRFNTIFTKLASEKNVIFMPFFLKDVATVPELNRADGIHPNQKGYAAIVKNLYPYVEQAIAEYRSVVEKTD